MTTDIEQGIAFNGTNPVLIEDFGGNGILGSAVSSFRTMSEQISLRLNRLDGDEFGVWIIYRRPSEMDFDDLDRSRLEEYIQSAGSRDALSIEIRRREADGLLHHYAIGRDVDEVGERTITWARDNPDGPRTLTLPAHEVFTTDQAHPVYLQWCWDQTIPAGHTLRELDLIAR